MDFLNTFLQKACSKNTFFVHNNSLLEGHYQMYAVVNKIANLKTGSQFAAIRLCSSTTFYFLLRCHIIKREKQFARTSNVTLIRVLVAKNKKNITYSESVIVAFLIQYAKRMHHIVICPALPYFFTLSYKRYDFRVKNVVLCFLSNSCL
jgi:hypothetical protein